MNNEKLTILYERLSHEDGRENESLSIENQKAYLEEYALRSGFKNLVHRTDDGWSGTRWDRPGFLQVTEDISRGSVGQILIKDMSRLGRDHLRVGLFLEQLREMNVRMIAVAEGIDTAKGEDDFMPFRNILAEWHARDTSRKIRAIIRREDGGGKPRYGRIALRLPPRPERPPEMDRRRGSRSRCKADIPERDCGKEHRKNHGGTDRRADTDPQRTLEKHRRKDEPRGAQCRPV